MEEDIKKQKKETLTSGSTENVMHSSSQQDKVENKERYLFEDYENREITVPTQQCIICGKDGQVTGVKRQDWITLIWSDPRERPSIQDLMPYLSIDDREQIITGTHPKCFETLGEEE